MDTARMTPAEMAADLIRTFPLSPDAPLKIAESHRQESITRQRHGAADYWSQVADLLASANQR